MRQQLIQHYRKEYEAQGLDYVDATNRAVDQADTDLRDLSQSEAREYVRQLREAKLG